MKSKEARKYIFSSLDDIVHVSIYDSFLCKREDGNNYFCFELNFQTVISLSVNLIHPCLHTLCWGKYPAVAVCLSRKMFLCHCLC